MLGFISGVNIGSAVRAAGRAVLGAPQAWPRCQAPQAMPFKGGYWPRRRSKACDLAKPAQNHRRRPLPAKSRWARSPLEVSNWAGSSASSRETGPDLARHFSDSTCAWAKRATSPRKNQRARPPSQPPRSPPRPIAKSPWPPFETAAPCPLLGHCRLF